MGPLPTSGPPCRVLGREEYYNKEIHCTGNNDPLKDNDICHEVKQGRLHRLMKLKYC